MNPRVSELTLKEKAGILSGASFWETRGVDRAGIAGAVLTDGPHGVRMQKHGADNLGILVSEPATSFPTAAATGSSWDPELLREMGVALGDEARATGVDILLGPGVNIKRSPLCGRNFEYFSEDPLLAGRLGAAWVSGIQSRGVGASVKHFAANNQETNRMRISVQVDERTLREIYLPAFEEVVTASQPATIMASYNRLNGAFASENRWLLTDVLRDEWGFDGYVVSDWGAVVDPVAAVAAGLDLEMPSTGDASPARIVAAVEAGVSQESDVDLAVSHILDTHERLRSSRSDLHVVDTGAHHALARRIATESSVLLVNDGNVLPLDPAAGGAIAVIGEFARTPRYQGAGSSHINPTQLDDALTAIRAATARPVLFEPGFVLEGDEDLTLVDAAVEAARSAEVVVAFLGLPAAEESEGFDRTHLDLPAVQLELLARVADVNPNVVVVLSNGGVVDLSPVVGHSRAILEMWLSGQAGGSAAADLLFGSAEPAGRLAETFPLALTDTPAFTNWPGDGDVVNYGERVYVGYRWYDTTEREVAFPFGFGLGYTTFAYSDLVVTVPESGRARAIVEVTVTNTGVRAGADVVQVYVRDIEAGLDRPKQELKGFSKVRLDAGGSTRVRIELDERAFAFWGQDGWTVEPGAFAIGVGASSRDIRVSSEIVLDVPAPIKRLDALSSLEDWLAHPIGAQIVQGALAGLAPEQSQAFMSEGVVEMVMPMPLKTLVSFTGGDADATVAALLEQVRQATAEASTR